MCRSTHNTGSTFRRSLSRQSLALVLTTAQNTEKNIEKNTKTNHKETNRT